MSKDKTIERIFKEQLKQLKREPGSFAGGIISMMMAGMSVEEAFAVAGDAIEAEETKGKC